MHVALVGPTHPYKGGVAAHTTELAHRLAAAGHRTDLVTWSRLYPDRLYPGEQAVPDGGPDLPPYPGTDHRLRWDRPAGWWATGRDLRHHEHVVVVVVVPAQVPALLTLVRALRSGRGPAPRVTVLAHNVVPHEGHPGARTLMSWMLRAADDVLVHSPQMAAQAAGLGAHRVVRADLPPHLPGGAPDADAVAASRAAAAERLRAGGRPRLLALGMVREYKGFDLLLSAASRVPGVEVTVAGEQWGQAGAAVRAAAEDPALAGRVELLGGYVPGVEVPGLLARHDVLALPYRHATASQNVLLARAHGLPVLATRVGTFGEQVVDGTDGLLVEPGDLTALTAAVSTLADPVRVAALTAGVAPVDLDSPWRDYLDVLVPAPAGDRA